MAKTAETYRAAAATFKEKGDKHYAKGCAAAKAGDKNTANQEHAAAQTCYNSMNAALEAAKKAPKG